MMKSKKYAFLILVVAIAVFNAFSFVAPIGKTKAFWIAYTFTNFAFVIQPLVWALAFKKADPLKAKFLGIPAVYVGTVYLILQIIAFVIICTVSVEAWISMIISAPLLGISLIVIIAASFGKRVVSETDEKVKEKVSFIKTLQVELEMILGAETNPETKCALQKLVDAVRYSDPVSDESTKAIEEEINIMIIDLKKNQTNIELISCIGDLLNKRNILCKKMK